MSGDAILALLGILALIVMCIGVAYFMAKFSEGGPG